jgi:hypothetical protein
VTKPLADFLAALRKLYDIPRPDSNPATANSSRPTASRESYLSWAVDKIMKESEMDKTAAQSAEEGARQLFDSDEVVPHDATLPPKIDEDSDDSLSDSMTSQG